MHICFTVQIFAYFLVVKFKIPKLSHDYTPSSRLLSAKAKAKRMISMLDHVASEMTPD